jgi:hypothetical protein
MSILAYLMLQCSQNKEIWQIFFVMDNFEEVLK